MRLNIQTIYGLFVFFLPFTQALTLNIFFPLKVSELLLAFLFLLAFSFKLNKVHLKILLKTRVVIFFIFLSTVSFVMNIFWDYGYPLRNIDFRIGKVSDSFLRLCYIFINIIAFFISFFLLSKHQSKALSFWVKGAIVAALYGWYIFLSSALDMPFVRLFGMEENPQALNGIIRCGTFKEGNFFGLYLLLSASVAFYMDKYKTGWFLLASIFMTFSTISIISGFLFVLMIFRKKIFKIKVFKAFLLSLPIIVIGFFLFIKSDFFQRNIYEKLFTPIHTLTPSNLSKVDRYLTSSIAFHQGIDNPIIGVGPFNYALHFDRYNNIDDLVKNHTEWSLEYFHKKKNRTIPNNIYMEVWSEYGLIGFCLFITFLIITLRVSFKNKNVFMTAGLIVMYISFNAFPSFIMLFLWVYMAIPFAQLYNRRLEK